MENNRPILFILLALWFSGISGPVAGFSLSEKLDSIQIMFDKQQLVLPGEPFRIGIVSYSKKGKIKSTKGILDGSVWWHKYKVEVTGGTDASGQISVNDLLMPSRGEYISIKAYPRRQPELVKELFVPMNYETKIVYQPANRFDKAPESQIKGELITEFNNGVSRVSKDLQNSRETDYFQFTSQGGFWNRGKFTIDPDFTKMDQHKAALIVKSLPNKSVADTFSVLLNSKHNYDLHISGPSGTFGLCGQGGSPGSSCYNGEDGQNGQNGEYGSDGPDLGVWIDLYRDSLLNRDLLYVYAQNLATGEESRYLINPAGGKLDVSSVGGNGGNGGNGGDGGTGGRGLEGERWVEKHIEKQMVKKPVTKKVIRKEKRKVIDAKGKVVKAMVDVKVNKTVYVDKVVLGEVQVVKQGSGGDGGEGGRGGAGGLGAPGGNGGNIALYFTDDARPYQHVIAATSNGGSGGMNGSGGRGGSGGSGGVGNLNGKSGKGGQSGLSAVGWAERGGSGNITIKPTQKFYIYTPKIQAQGK